MKYLYLKYLYFGFVLFGSIVFSAPNKFNNTMNIISMNIHCQNDHWEFRLNEILNKIIELSPDIIAFQEVCENSITHESQISFIKNKLIQGGYPLRKMDVQFTHKAWNKWDEYVMLLSKNEVRFTDKGLLPPSILQRGYIAFNIENTWFITTHLEYKQELFQHRINEIEFLTKRYENQSHMIMGDFNSSPLAIEQNRFIQKKYTAYFPGASFVGDPNDKNNFIDGFWLSPLFSSQVVVTAAKILLKEAVQGILLSDHAAVWIQFQRRRPY